MDGRRMVRVGEQRITAAMRTCDELVPITSYCIDGFIVSTAWRLRRTRRGEQRREGLGAALLADGAAREHRGEQEHRGELHPEHGRDDDWRDAFAEMDQRRVVGRVIIDPSK